MSTKLETLLSPGLTRARDWSRHWALPEVVIPFLLTRFALFVTGWFSRYFRPDPYYPIEAAVARGWQFSPHRLIDIWGRWDTGWYLSIVNHGYNVPGDLHTVQSSIAFFPLYPYMVKVLTFLLPARLRTPGAEVFLGAVVSNVLLLWGLILLYKLVTSSLNDAAIARRTVVYMLLFPTSFFFSCCYSESTFLFLSVAAFYAASRQAWWRSALLGGLLALTRPLGVLILIPLVWIYLQAREWKLRKVGWEIVSFLLVPAGLVVYSLSIYHLTGDLLAPLQVQAAWGRGLALPWQTIASPTEFNPFITPVDQMVVVGFILLGLVSLVLLPKSYGLYSLALMLPPLFTGTLMSVARYYLPIFPIFIVLAMAGRWRAVDRFLAVTFFVVQVLFMAAWSQFYWIG